MRNFLLVLSCAICLAGCTENKLGQALKLAGDNRSELEKVLANYSAPGDELKYKAAVFLISNMPGHYHVEGKLYGEFCNEIRPVALSAMPMHEKFEIIEAVASRYKNRLETRQDILYIRADYLIRNIDEAFTRWEEEKWATHLTFDEFCRYLLPYKVIDFQPLDMWRDSLKNLYNGNVDRYLYCPYMEHCNLEIARDIHNEMKSALDPAVLYTGSIPFLDAGLIGRIPYGTCQDYSVSATAVYRSKGIPVALDYTPQWSNRSLGHGWNVLLMNDGRMYDFGAVTDNEPGQVMKIDERKAKVYRRTYDRNEALVELNRREKNVPYDFRGFFIEDVTGSYRKTGNFSIPVRKNRAAANKYGYIATFDDTQWYPVGYGKRKGGRVYFEDVGLNHIFLPVFETESGRKHFNSPFKFTFDGEIEYLTADTSDLFSFTFTRKYPVVGRTFPPGVRLIGGRIEAANRQDFSDAVTIYTCREWKADYSVRTDTLPAYRYWRYCSAEGAHTSISEMMFFSASDSLEKVKGRVIGTDGSWDDDPERTKYAMFDDDLLTHYDASESSGSWAGMDFGEPVRLSRIIIYPNTDGNNIEIGDTYELYYFGEDGWVPIGRQVARDISITFDGIPSGGLYLLDDISKGKEKRIFTIENGRQVWW